MMTIAVLCGFGGLVLGLSSNVRMLILVVLLMLLAAFVAGVLQEGLGLAALAWALTALITSQVGYMTMIIARAGYAEDSSRARQSAPFKGQG